MPDEIVKSPASAPSSDHVAPAASDTGGSVGSQVTRTVLSDGDAPVSGYGEAPLGHLGFLVDVDDLDRHDYRVACTGRVGSHHINGVGLLGFEVQLGVRLRRGSGLSIPCHMYLHQKPLPGSETVSIVNEGGVRPGLVYRSVCPPSLFCITVLVRYWPTTGGSSGSSTPIIPKRLVVSPLLSIGGLILRRIPLGVFIDVPRCSIALVTLGIIVLVREHWCLIVGVCVP